MRQENGVNLLGANDPRSFTLGLIYVSPEDDRESVLAAILTQDKLGRKQVIVILPGQNRSFCRPIDFDGLRNMQRKLQAMIIVIAPAGSAPAEHARRKHFRMFSSLENYKLWLDEHFPLDHDVYGPDWQSPFEPSAYTPPTDTHSDKGEPTFPLAAFPEPPTDTLLPPTEHTPLPQDVPMTDLPVPPVVDEHEQGTTSEEETETGTDAGPKTNEKQIVYLAADEDVSQVRDRLHDISASHILLMVPAQSQMRSLISWRLLYSRVTELKKDVTVVCADRQIRAIAKNVGFNVLDSLENRAERKNPPRRSRRSQPAKETEELPSVKLPEPASSQPEKEVDVPPESPGFMETLPPPVPLFPQGDEDEDEDPWLEDVRQARWIREASSVNIPQSEMPVEETTTAHAEDGAVSGEQAASEQEDSKLDDIQLPSPAVAENLAGDEMHRPSLTPVEDDEQAQERPQVPTLLPRRRLQKVVHDIGVRARPTIISRTGYTGSDTPIPLPFGPTAAAPRPRFSRRSLWLIGLCLLLLVLIGGYIAREPVFTSLGAFFPGLTPSAQVTITPMSKFLKESFPIPAVVGVPDTAQHQVSARVLSYTPATQTRTIKATGIGIVPVVPARGTLTFYNALPTAQTIPAGIVFTDANGIEVVNDAPATVPAALPPAEGMATVPAHVINSGIGGNIPAFDFNNVLCCGLPVTVQNRIAFSGGQEQQEYSFVQQSDIDTAVTVMRTSLEQDIAKPLKAQMLPGEQMIGSIHCLPQVVTDHVAGDRVLNVTISVTDTCTVEVFSLQAAQAMAEQELKTRAEQSLIPDYALVDKVRTTLLSTQISDNRGTVALLVQAEGTWFYQFTDVQKLYIIHAIAGKSVDEVRTSLAKMAGIREADIDLSWTGGSHLPSDPRNINLVFK